jgi:uncharacterized protein (TIGR02452 family)
VNNRLREIAHDTLSIVERGFYDGPAGRVDLAGDVARGIAGTRMFAPDTSLGPVTPVGTAPPLVEVTHESSLAAVLRLGAPVACLVFASARNPGGGFLNGAQAQEESLARSSALHAAQTSVPQFYAHHRGDRDVMYSDRVIHSRDVPVFRDDDGNLLPAVVPVTFLTAAAPNRGVLLQKQYSRAGAVPEVLRGRARRVLEIAQASGDRRLVLGAWGCGVFRNDPATVARIFAGELRTPRGFTHVTFAVLDRRTRDVFAQEVTL